MGAVAPRWVEEDDLWEFTDGGIEGAVRRVSMLWPVGLAAAPLSVHFLDLTRSTAKEFVVAYARLREAQAATSQAIETCAEIYNHLSPTVDLVEPEPGLFGSGVRPAERSG